MPGALPRDRRRCHRSTARSRHARASGRVGQSYLGLFRPGEANAGAAAFGRNGDGPPVALHDLLHDREPDAAALDVVARTKGLKDAKDTLMELRRDPGAVIADRNLDTSAGVLRLDG